MSGSNQLSSHLFLIQPLNKKYKEVIVYADTEKQARTAATSIDSFEKNPAVFNEFSAETIYQDKGMSICIEIEPDKIKSIINSDEIQIEYKGVLYHLKKNEAKQVISENFL